MRASGSGIPPAPLQGAERARGGPYLRGASWRPAACVRASLAVLWPGPPGSPPLTSGDSCAPARTLRRPPPARSEHAGKAHAREGCRASGVRTRRSNQSGVGALRFRPCGLEVAAGMVRFCACAEHRGPVIGCQRSVGGAFWSTSAARTLFPWKPDTVLPRWLFSGPILLHSGVCAWPFIHFISSCSSARVSRSPG